MIESDEVARRLVSGAASIGRDWERHREDWDGKPAGFYNDVTVVAQHVVALMATGDHAEIAAVFAELERLLGPDLSREANNLLIVGFLEDVHHHKRRARRRPVLGLRSLPWPGDADGVGRGPRVLGDRGHLDRARSA
jgi:hypothetical protein